MQKKILLADDNSSVRETLCRVLESENYTVVTSKTGRETGATFNKELPDLVLLDVTMPDQNGWEVFKLIKGTPPRVPVIIITAKPHQHNHATELGVDALMEKPLDLPLLLNAIANFLAESKDERTHRLTCSGFHTLLLTADHEAAPRVPIHESSPPT